MASSSRPRTAERAAGSAAATPSRGRADLARLRRVSDAEIARTAPPELATLPDDFWDEGVPVLPPAKVPISLRVDADVLAWFREAGPRYQSRMNAVLRSYMERVGAAPATPPASRSPRSTTKRRGTA
jgi:uncharacterized protein (DUF4415 family)